MCLFDEPDSKAISLWMDKWTNGGNYASVVRYCNAKDSNFTVRADSKASVLSYRSSYRNFIWPDFCFYYPAWNTCTDNAINTSVSILMKFKHWVQTIERVWSNTAACPDNLWHWTGTNATRWSDGPGHGQSEMLWCQKQAAVVHVTPTELSFFSHKQNVCRYTSSQTIWQQWCSKWVLK